MSRTVLVVLVLAVLAVVLLFAFDPMGFFGASVEREEEAQLEEALEEAGEITLAGQPVEGALEGDPVWVEGERVGILDLKLGTSALTGTVTGDGTVLFGARVRAVLPGPAAQKGVRTRSDGTWEIRGLPAGAHELRAAHHEWRGRTVVAPGVADDATLDVGAIDLDRRHESTDAIHVKVSDELGRPVAGAKVVACSTMYGLHLLLGPELSGMSDVHERRAVTDEKGETLLTKLPPETYDVVAIAEGYTLAAQPNVLVGEGRTKHLRFVLSRGASISGIVVDAEGNPLAGAFAMGLHMPSFASSLAVTTGADGRFTLDGLRTGSYMLIAGHDDHGEGMVNPAKSPSTGLRVQLGGAGKVALQVVSTDGTPLTRYQVRPYRAEPFGYTYSMRFNVQDEEGRTELKLSPGTYTLAVKSEAGDFSTEAKATVTVGEITEVKVELPQSRTVSGVVVDPEGRHVAGVEVYVRQGGMPTQPRREQYARTNAEGEFTIAGLPMEQIRLHARHTRWAPVVFEVPEGAAGTGDEITIRMPAGGAIEGTVLHGDGSPAAGEPVSAFMGFNFFEAKSTVTDDAGRYLFPALAGGKYTVSTGPFENMGGGVSKQNIEVPADGSVTVDIQLEDPEATGVVVGTVTSGGQPLQGATVMVLDGRGWDQMVRVETDASGGFRAEGVVPGEGVTVRVSTTGGVAKSETVEVPAEGEATVAVNFTTTLLQGRLLTSAGAAVSGAWIAIERVGTGSARDWSNVAAQTTSSAEGTFEAQGLEPGRYQVRVTGSGLAGFLSDPVEVTEGGTADLGTFTLAPGLSIGGRVVDDAGAPVEDATISLKDATGRPVFNFSLISTGSDGRYEMTGLEPGRYTVGFEAKGYAPASKTVDLAEGSATADGVVSRGGAISVLVQDEGGTSLSGARVTLLDDRGQRVERTLSLVSLGDGDAGRVGDDGRATIPDLAPGLYTVTVRRGGWTAATDWPMVRVSSGTESPVTVVLIPGE